MPDNISQAFIFVGKLVSIVLAKTGIIALDTAGVSRDSEVIVAYINDPLVYLGKTTARLGSEIVKTMQIVTKQAPKIKLPIMIMQESNDKLVDPSGAQLLYNLVTSRDKTIKIYDGFYHEIFIEPEHKEVLSDVLK